MTRRNYVDLTEFVVNDIIRVQWDITDWSFARVLGTLCDDGGEPDGLQVLALDYSQDLYIHRRSYAKDAVRKATPKEIELLTTTPLRTLTPGIVT